MSNQIMDTDQVKRAITRIAHEILERNKGACNVCLIGIRTRGVALSERLQQAIEEIENKKVSIGILDINLYRDDLSLVSHQPIVRASEIDFDVNEKIVVLVDDVLFTGRTIRAALDALNDFGRPSQIQLAVLIDRGHRELPIRADFVGKNIPTSKEQDVQVVLTETDKSGDKVVVEG